MDVVYSKDIVDIDLMRIARATLYGGAVLGPFLGVWYNTVLPYLVRGVPDRKTRFFGFTVKVLAMVTYDQLIESVF